MKKLSAFAVIIISILFLASCEKKDKLPNIAFIKGDNYVSSDITLTKDTTVTVGIKASKSETYDVLKKFNSSRTYGSGTSESLIRETLSGGNSDNYTRDIQITTRNQAGTEKYTFTVVNQNGLINEISLTLTVK